MDSLGPRVKPAKKVRLGDVCKVVLGGTPSTRVPEYWDGDVPWLTPGDMGKTKGLYVSETSRKLTRAGLQTGSTLFPASSIVVSTRAPIGYVLVNTVPMCTNQGCKTLVPDATVHAEYLCFYLRSRIDELNSLGTGTTFKELSTRALQSVRIPLPSLPAQRRIAAALDLICELKKNAETRLAKLDLLVKSLFVEMFGEGKYPEVTIESLAAHEKNAFKAGPFGSSLKKEFYVESGYKIYGQEQVISGDVNYGDYYIDEAKYKTLESCKIQEGDVLVSLVGTYGKTLVIPHSFQPGIINPRLIKLTFDKERISPIYFQQFFSLDSTRDMLDRNCHGCTMGVLNLGIIKALKIPLPPLVLQREFAAFVEKVEKLKEIAKRSAEQLDVLYRSKLQEYFG